MPLSEIQGLSYDRYVDVYRVKVPLGREAGTNAIRQFVYTRVATNVRCRRDGRQDVARQIEPLGANPAENLLASDRFRFAHDAGVREWDLLRDKTPGAADYGRWYRVLETGQYRIGPPGMNPREWVARCGKTNQPPLDGDLPDDPPTGDSY